MVGLLTKQGRVTFRILKEADLNPTKKLELQLFYRITDSNQVDKKFS